MNDHGTGVALKAGERNALRSLERYIAREKRPPSMAEIGRICGRSPNWGWRQIFALKKAGMVQTSEGSHRSLRITPAGEEWLARDRREDRESNPNYVPSGGAS